MLPHNYNRELLVIPKGVILNYMNYVPLTYNEINKKNTSYYYYIIRML